MDRVEGGGYIIQYVGNVLCSKGLLPLYYYIPQLHVKYNRNELSGCMFLQQYFAVIIINVIIFIIYIIKIKYYGHRIIN